MRSQKTKSDDDVPK